MKIKFSRLWIRSKQPRKQRKYRHNAPLHIKKKFMNVHLSKELRKKYERRNISIRKGDVVKILRGQFKGKQVKVEKVILKKNKVFLEGIQRIKSDGSKSYYPVNPSNLVIINLNLEDKKRKEKLGKDK